MTDKELQKLGRRELLQLLLEQAKESERLGKALAETEEQLQQMQETYERLRERLDNKDAQIHELKATLAEVQEKREVDMENVGSIAEAALKLNGVFDAAQRAADHYLQSIRALYPPPEGVEIPPLPEKPEAEPVSEPGSKPNPLRQAQDKKPVDQAGKSSWGKRPFHLKKQQEKGKLTLFFGWQHD